MSVQRAFGLFTRCMGLVRELVPLRSHLQPPDSVDRSTGSGEGQTLRNDAMVALAPRPLQPSISWVTRNMCLGSRRAPPALGAGHPPPKQPGIIARCSYGGVPWTRLPACEPIPGMARQRPPVCPYLRYNAPQLWESRGRLACPAHDRSRHHGNRSGSAPTGLPASGPGHPSGHALQPYPPPIDRI